MKWGVVCLSLLSLSVTHFSAVRAQRSTNHVGRICSTWGREHFKTFDGDFYQFPGACEYNFVSDCKTDFKEFSVHIKRTNSSGNPTISYVVVTINNLVFRLSKDQITVNKEAVSTPYLKAGVQVENNADYVKLQSKVGITLMWNGADAVMVEIESDYAGRTCGLCGNFDGVQGNDFTFKGRQMNEIEFGNKQKVRLPNDECEDLYEGDDEPQRPTEYCPNTLNVCNKLRSPSWTSCTSLINPEPFYMACVREVCSCSNTSTDFCLCSTLSEFSRLCSHAGGEPPSWRSADFCEKKCPYNMVYEESGSPCMDTCTNEDTSSLCEEHKIDGCFCPSGTVFDDISKKGCIPQSECQCKHDKIYQSGEVYRQDKEECTCNQGTWECRSLETPESCAIEDGSHVTTFDGKTFAFHGSCYYTLAKVESKDPSSPAFTILALMSPCSSQELDTCLKAVNVVLNNDKNDVIKFNSDGSITHNSEITLPYRSGGISIFQASSFHIMLQTSFGLQIQIQHVPIMQVYIKLDQSYAEKTRGLCGNYNRKMADDIKTRQGIVEGTATTFIDSWKSNAQCSDVKERLDDPCSFSVENEQYAKYWCALLRSKNSTFSPCHVFVDPELYYQRCVYSTCSCEKSEACLCGVFSSYAQACAAKGVSLPEWSESVCDKYMKSCPASQVFSFSQKRCQLTCRALASKENSCLSDFSPVDGCNCADGSYLDENNVCVPVSKCPCKYNDILVKAGKSITIKDERCVCSNAVLRCQSLTLQPSKCVAPKVFYNCSAAGEEKVEQQCTRTCANPDKDDCDSTECESGCRCPEGLLEDGKGSCVKESECPCKHNNRLYPTGAQIPKDCNTCTCNSGIWNCTEKQCPATCIIYGSGHYTTFDQQTYTFQGNCAYTAVKNKCGSKTPAVNFGVITENVPCGSTGTTCSKSVRVHLGRNEIKLFKGSYQEQDLGSGAEVEYKVRRVGLYLLIESSIGLAVVWDRRTTVRILLEPQHSGEVCGLCGNYDGDGQNDFTTQRQLVVSSPLDFGNSWKKSSSCPDAENVDNPCDASPNRFQWSKMMCSIITGETFKDCQQTVDPRPFYENCLKDSCACDGGGDCECFCAAVATYAQACSEAGVCVAWRTPEICPIFCDYFNHPDGCEWHYSPCHTPCLKTCSNPTGVCLNPLPQLEGCFPACPEDKPFLDERNHTCVKDCAPTIITTTIVPLKKVTTTETPTTTTLSTTLPPGVTTSNKTTLTTSGSTIQSTGSTTTPMTPTTISNITTSKASTPLTPGVTPTNQTTPTGSTSTGVTPTTPSVTTVSNVTTAKVSTTLTPGVTPTNQTTPTGSTSIPPKTSTPSVTTVSNITTAKVSTTLTPGVTPTNQTTPTGSTSTGVTPTTPSVTTVSNVTTAKVSTTLTPGVTPTNQTTPTGSTSVPPKTSTPSVTTVSNITTAKVSTTLTPGVTPTNQTTPTGSTSTGVTPTTPFVPTPPNATTPTTSTKLPPGVTTTFQTTPTGSTLVPPKTPTTPSISTVSNTTTPTTLTTTLPSKTTPRNQTTTSVKTPQTTTTPTSPLTPNITKAPTVSPTTQVPTTTPNVTKPSTESPTTSLKPTVPPDHCPKFNAMVNETFHFCNCTMARCNGNDTLQIIPYECPPVAEIACSNNKKAILEWDEFHCCQHPVCECVCEGWGESHYNTFDGSYYSYKGKCTYVLMEEITPKFNLKIYIDGGSCDPNEESCPRSIIVSYGSLVVRLNGSPKLEAQADSKSVKLPFSQGGIKIINSGINLLLEIPRIEVVIEYSKSGFSVFVPVKTFGRNTQGHCGTCNNIQSDDCMLPDGQLVKSCAAMADKWLVPSGSDKPDCNKPLVPLATTPAGQGPQTSPQVSSTNPLIKPGSTIPTGSTLPPLKTYPTVETPSTLTKSTSLPTGPKGPTEANTQSSPITTGPSGITKTQTSLPNLTGTLGKTTTGFQAGQTKGGLSTKSTSPGVSLGSTTKPASAQVSETSSSVGPASTTIPRSTLPPSGTENTVKTPEIITGTTSPPIASKEVTKTSKISATTNTFPETGKTKEAISRTTLTSPASSQETKSSFPIGSTSAIISRPTLQPSGTEGLIQTPSTITKSTSQPSGTRGATGTTISPPPTEVPGKTQTQKTVSKQTGETVPTKSTPPGPSASPGSTTQQTSPKISEIPTSPGSASTVRTKTSVPGTESQVSTPSTATGTTLTPTERKASPGAQRTSPSSQPTASPGITETTTKKYTGPSTESTSGVKKPTSETSSSALPPAATTEAKLTESYSPSGTGATTEKTSPKLTKPGSTTSKTVAVTTQIPSGKTVTSPSGSTAARGKPTTTRSQTTLPPGVTPTTPPTASGTSKITGSTTQQLVPPISPTTPSGFKATTITKITTPRRGSGTPSVTSPGVTKTPSKGSSPGVTQFIQTTPFLGSTTASPQGSTLETGFPKTTKITLPVGSSTVKAATKPTNESTQSGATSAARLTTQPVEYSSTAPTPCRKDSLCGLLTGADSPFAECHDSVSPRNFYSSCASDSCSKADPAVECESLERYAAACAGTGVCIDWRNYTELCVSDCPSDRVYKACGPAQQPTCEDHLDEAPINVTTEGCFCPEGMKLFNKDSDVCVKTCGCLDPENKPREFNETFEYSCQECTCHKSKTVTCKPKECPEANVTACEHPGYVRVNETNPLDPCCTELVCQCDISTCTVPDMTCTAGFKPVLNVPEGICCPNYLCVPKKVCVHEDVEYENGSSVPSKKCEECVCSDATDSFSGGLLAINCTALPCNDTCEEGSEYVMKDSDKCCGRCEPTHCVVTENGTTQLLIEGESWSPPTNKCEVHVCVKTDDTLVTLTSTVPCPHFNESECLPHTIQTLANGCCKTCEEKEKACKKVSSQTQITHKGCTSKDTVDLPSCEGSCNTFSKYSLAAESMEHSCACCKELRSSNRTVDLVCADGTSVTHTYMHVEECGCDPTECVEAEGAPSRRRRSFPPF